jgi:hypothetical protein
LRVSGYHGDVGDSLTQHNGQAFSTYDKDHDIHPGTFNCAKQFKGAWWYYECYVSNLNGMNYYPVTDGNTNGIVWNAFGGYTPLKSVEMAIRPMPKV